MADTKKRVARAGDFLRKALEVWRQTAPGIVIDCIEMDTVWQERALLDARISVGLLVPSNRRY